MTDEELAQMFHREYERLAPQFGYKTREASAVPWDQVPDNNRLLMVAVAGSIRTTVEAEVTRLGDVIDEYKEVIDLHHTDFVKIREWCRQGLGASRSDASEVRFAQPPATRRLRHLPAHTPRSPQRCGKDSLAFAVVSSGRRRSRVKGRA